MSSFSFFLFLGHSQRARKSARNQCDIVRWKSVILHNGRTDLRVILPGWGLKKDYNGTGQG